MIITGTLQPPRQMGPSPCKRCSRSNLGASIMDSSLGLNIFTALFLSGTFLAALVAGLGGFAFGIIAAAVWLYILTPLQTATLIMGAAFGVPLGVFILAHADPHYLRRGVGVVLTVFSLYGLLRPAITPIKS